MLYEYGAGMISDDTKYLLQIFSHNYCHNINNNMNNHVFDFLECARILNDVKLKLRYLFAKFKGLSN